MVEQDIKCPECKSTQLKLFGKKWAMVDGKRQRIQQYQCKDCGRITVNPVVINE